MDQEDLPPSYEEIIPADSSPEHLPNYSEATLKDIVAFPSAILLDGVRGQFPKVHISLTDTNGSLLARANVNVSDGTILLLQNENIAEQNFLTVESKTIGETNARTFKVFHNDIELGTGEIVNSRKIKLYSSYENRIEYSVEVYFRDIIVSRTLRSSPISHMYLPWDGFGPVRPFCLRPWNGRINFPCETETATRVEQSLCISLAIVFMLSQSNNEYESGLNSIYSEHLSPSAAGHAQLNHSVNTSISVPMPSRRNSLPTNSDTHSGEMFRCNTNFSIFGYAILFIALWVWIYLAFGMFQSDSVPTLTTKDKNESNYTL